MPPRSQQPRDKDRKFLPKNSKSGQPPSSLATPSISKRVDREASPTGSTIRATPLTHSASRACSTSRSRSKRAQMPPNSPSKQQKDPLRSDRSPECSRPRTRSPSHSDHSQSPSPSSEHKQLTETENLLKHPKSQNVSASAFSKIIKTIISMCHTEDEAPCSSFLPPAAYLPLPPTPVIVPHQAAIAAIAIRLTLSLAFLLLPRLTARPQV